MRQVFPIAGEEIDVRSLYADLILPEPGLDRPYVILNMVSTVDGKVTIGGRAAPIGGEGDHWAMRNLRLLADAVMSGAGTLRAEGFDPTVPEHLVARRVAAGRPPQPLGIVVTDSLVLPFDRGFFQKAGFERLVFTTEQAVSLHLAELLERARVLRLGARAVDLPAALRLLRRELAIRTLVVEGGPTLNYSLIARGLVDELFWTIAPKVIGGSGLTLVAGQGFPPGRPVPVELVSAHAHRSELYLRYRFG